MTNKMRVLQKYPNAKASKSLAGRYFIENDKPVINHRGLGFIISDWHDSEVVAWADAAARLEQEPKAERAELPPRETFSLLPTAEVEELKSQLAQCRQREQEMRGKLKDIRAYVRDGLYHASLDAIEEVLAAIPQEESNGK